MQKKQAVSILDIPVHPLTMEEAVTFLQTAVQGEQQVFVVTANAEIIMLAQDDPAYKELLQKQADLVLPDGAGTVWGGRTLGYAISERVAGYVVSCGRLPRLAGVFFWRRSRHCRGSY